MSSVRFLFSGLVLIVTALASPIEQRAAATTQAIPSRITSPAQLNSIISGLEADGTELALGASVFLDLASAIVPAPNPTAIAAEISSVASVYKAHPTFAFESALNLISAGLTPTDAYDLLTQSSPIENSSDNNNSINPSPPVYPSAAKGDAPYSQSEKKLRSALYIPRGFTYGKVPPLIFVPGKTFEFGILEANNLLTHNTTRYWSYSIFQFHCQLWQDFSRIELCRCCVPEHPEQPAWRATTELRICRVRYKLHLSDLRP